MQTPDFINQAAAPGPEAKSKPHPTRGPRRHERPEGWWCLENLQGTREGLLREINARAEIPQGWKTAILAQIAATPPEFNFFYLDAHYHVDKNNESIHLTLQRAKAIV